MVFGFLKEIRRLQEENKRLKEAYESGGMMILKEAENGGENHQYVRTASFTFLFQTFIGGHCRLAYKKILPILHARILSC